TQRHHWGDRCFRGHTCNRAGNLDSGHRRIRSSFPGPTRGATMRTGAFPSLVWLAPLVVVLSPLATEAQSLPTARAEDVGMSTERLQRLTDRVDYYIDNDQIAGAVTLVARDGKVVHLESHGHRDREAGIPMEVDDIFVIMSMTKPIVSTALMMLHEEGKFLLTDPISKWLPEFADMKVLDEDAEGGLGPARPITVRHVLTHTAGLATSGTRELE